MLNRSLSLLLALVLCVILTCSAYADDDRLEIHVLDVGASDAILFVQYKSGQEHAMMIDTGDSEHTSFLNCYIKDKGIRSLDFLVLTHPHADHIGGAESIINTLSVGKLYATNVEADTLTYRRVMDVIRKKNVQVVYPQVNDTFFFGEALFTVFAPHPVLYPSSNDWSLVLMMEYHGFRMLFAGDAEINSENDMMNDTSLDLHADILKVGHHGSQTSTCYAFAQAVSPKYAIISCGTSKIKEYPDIEVGMNLIDAGVETILSTNKVGTIVIKIDTQIKLDYQSVLN